MFEPAVLSALEFPIPPSAPNVSVERIWLSPGAERAQKVADRNAEAYGAYARGWREQLERVRVAANLIPIEPMTPVETAALDALIAEVEAAAEDRAVASARFSKRVSRETKREFATDPSRAAVRRSFADRLLQIDQEVIETILDYALFLRAMRAERLPNARRGRTFDNPGALARYLDSEVA